MALLGAVMIAAGNVSAADAGTTVETLAATYNLPETITPSETKAAIYS